MKNMMHTGKMKLIESRDNGKRIGFLCEQLYQDWESGKYYLLRNSEKEIGKVQKIWKLLSREEAMEWLNT